MQSTDYWRLCEQLSIFHAIMLILGYEPENQMSYDVENNRDHAAPQGYSALKTALVNGIKSKQIEGELLYQNFDHRNNELQCATINLDESIISVESLKEFLKVKSFTEGFFFPEGNISEGYLDSENTFFAPKLAATIHAWKAVTSDKELLNGKTPKQALEKWLRENASQFGLTKEDGCPNETGIQEICKIANWKPEGGAAKTPTHSKVKGNLPTPQQKPQKLRFFGDEEPPLGFDEEEIPF